jgi:anti-sigma factor RsiW
MLDIYGELSPEDRPPWEKHLEICENCRQERQRLITLIRLIRKEMRATELSEDDEASLLRSISNHLRSRSSLPWLKRRIWGLPLTPLPALAAAVLLFLGLGLLVLQELDRTPVTQTVVNFESEEQMIVQQLEILENLDFLKEMETISKLVQVVDHRDTMLRLE